MPTVKTNLVSYNVRDVNTKYGERKLTEFVGIDGTKYSTWKAEMASQVKAMLNQPVVVDYEVKKNGDYENYYLNSVVTEEDLNNEDPLILENTLSDIPTATPQSSKDASIARAVALKAAVATPLKFSSPDEVIALAKVYENYLNDAVVQKGI